MKYKLINNKTKEEHICDKVTIDGFDYYVDNKVVTERFEGYLIDDEGFIRHGMSCEKSIKSLNGKKVIATNNPNIDTPKVVDEIDTMREILVDSYLEKIKDVTKRFFWKVGFKHGYNKFQETHPFSANDMFEFHKWLNKNDWKDYSDIKEGLFVNIYGVQKQDKELLQLWKEQQPKIVYYE